MCVMKATKTWHFLNRPRPAGARAAVSGGASVIRDKNRAVVEASGCILMESGCQNGSSGQGEHMWIPRFLRGRIAAVAFAGLVLCGSGATQAAAQDRWEKAIQAFEAADREQAPPQNGIVFIGSSSIRMWKLEDYFAELPVVNRGFGGSQLADSVRYADRILLPYRPKVVVLYAGDNDISAGKSPEQVLGDFKEFVSKVHGALPETRIVFVAIKPSIQRWHLVETMRRANGLIRGVTEEDPRLVYLDIDGPMLGPDGKPRPELFLADGLHLQPAGYKIWATLLRPYLTLE